MTLTVHASFDPQAARDADANLAYPDRGYCDWEPTPTPTQPWWTIVEPAITYTHTQVATILHLEPTVPDEDWRDRARCAGGNTNLFYPVRGDTGATTRLAQAICTMCPVTVECLHYALNNNERHGTWGGLNVRDRITIRRRWRAEGKAA